MTEEYKRCIHCESEAMPVTWGGMFFIYCSSDWCDASSWVTNKNENLARYDWNKLNTPTEGPAWRLGLVD